MSDDEGADFAGQVALGLAQKATWAHEWWEEELEELDRAGLLHRGPSGRRVATLSREVPHERLLMRIIEEGRRISQRAATETGA